eukprot:3528703-Pyramimonas_sp.AAC.2
MTTAMRITERLHADIYIQWEANKARDYDWTARGGGAENAMWIQALAEEGLPDNVVSLGAVPDLEKAFEHISAYLLWDTSPGLDFPRQMIHLFIYMCTGPRWIMYQRIVSRVCTVTYSA